MKTLALGIALSFLSFAPLVSVNAHEDETVVHEGFEWGEEMLEAGEKALAACYECVFPLDWLESQGSEILESMVVRSEEDLVHLTSLGLPSKALSGRMAYPVRGGARFLSGLGERRSGGRRHQGVDLGAPIGTPVVSSWPGRVVKAGRGGLGGWAAKVLHPNGLSTYYAHFNGAPRVRTGQLVSAGEVIGGVGMSGNARGTTPHLHFEVRRGGAVLNPVSFIGR